MTEKREKIIAASVAILIGFVPVFLDGDATFLLLVGAVLIGTVFMKVDDDNKE